MKRNIIIRIIGLFSFGCLVVASFGQGCGRMVAVGNDSGSDSTADSASMASTSSATTGIAISANTQTISLVYGKQVLDHYNSCLGTGVPSDRTIAMWQSKKGTVSENGQVMTLTAPMLVATTSIAGELCEDLIAKEKLAPRLFVGFDMAGTTLPSNSNIHDAIRRLSRSCWSRDEDTTESDLITTSVLDTFGTTSEASKVHDAALFMCTAALASLDALIL